MENFVFIVTNNEDHWSDISEQLKKENINFYPKTREEFNRLRSLCHCSFSVVEDIVAKADKEIKEILSKFPKKILCFIRFQITEGDAFENGVLFSRFYEKFLISNSAIKLVMYFEFKGDCSCGNCYAKKEKQEKEAMIYCEGKRIPYFYWNDDYSFFVKDKYEMVKLPREELWLVDIIKTGRK